jgi:hypothetical protein
LGPKSALAGKTGSAAGSLAGGVFIVVGVQWARVGITGWGKGTCVSQASVGIGIV